MQSIYLDKQLSTFDVCYQRNSVFYGNTSGDVTSCNQWSVSMTTEEMSFYQPHQSSFNLSPLYSPILSQWKVNDEVNLPLCQVISNRQRGCNAGAGAVAAGQGG